MERRQEWHAEASQQRQMQPIHVGVDHIEIGGPQGYGFEESRLSDERIRARTAKPKRPRPSRNKLGAGLGIATCEQRHLMTKLHQLFDEPRDDTFRTAIEFGWDTFGEWGKLCDPHFAFRLSAPLKVKRALCFIDCKKIDPILEQPAHQEAFAYALLRMRTEALAQRRIPQNFTSG